MLVTKRHTKLPAAVKVCTVLIPWPIMLLSLVAAKFWHESWNECLIIRPLFAEVKNGSQYLFKIIYN